LLPQLPEQEIAQPGRRGDVTRIEPGGYDAQQPIDLLLAQGFLAQSTYVLHSAPQNGQSPAKG
jgi:hypothetical protein